MTTEAHRGRQACRQRDRNLISFFNHPWTDLASDNHTAAEATTPCGHVLNQCVQPQEKHKETKAAMREDDKTQGEIKRREEECGEGHGFKTRASAIS